MKKHFVLLIACCFAGTFIFSQENESTVSNTSQQSFFAELGGPGILFSANYDRRFKKTNLGLGARIGIGFVTGWETVYDPNTGYYNYSDQRSVLTLPFQLNYIFGKPNSAHAFEVGAGITYMGKRLEVLDFYEEKRSNIFGTASFMYRRQPKDGGFSWRAGFTPLFANGLIQPFGAISVGYNF